MKIAYLTHYFPPAGFAASINTYKIVEGLIRKGHEVCVFCPQTFSKYTATISIEQKTMPPNLEVYPSLPTPLPLSSTVPHLLSTVKALRTRFDLVISQFHLFHLASLAGFLLKAIRKKAWIVKVHDMIPDSRTLRSPIQQRVFIQACFSAFLNYVGKKADKVLVLTEDLRNLLLKNKYSVNSVAVIPNGVDTKVFCPPSSNEYVFSKKTVLYIGSMTRDDGLDCLIKAIALLNQQNESNLVIIGDGPERALLHELVKKLNLGKKVSFYRYVRHDLIPEFIRGAYVTVGPLRLSPINTYTIPTKILEYFACGKPVVSAPVSKGILRDEFTGLVVKDVTPKKVSEKFSVLIEDEELATRLGRNARQLVEQRFDWSRITDLLEKEIEEVGTF